MEDAVTSGVGGALVPVNIGSSNGVTRLQKMHSFFYVNFFFYCKSVRCLYEILFFAFDFMVITNKSVKLGISNLVWRYIININYHSNCIWISWVNKRKSIR
jgi:hypothetical protein